MPTLDLSWLNEPPWTTWYIVASGAVAALLVLLLGWLMLGRKRPPRKPLSSAVLLPPSLRQPILPQHDPFVQGSAGEQRAAPRRKGNPVAVLLGDAEGKIEPIPGTVLDRSVGGLRLLVGVPIAVGRLLRVRPAETAPSTPWVQIEVKNTRQVEQRWEIGCQFVHTPSWGVLLLFG
jgi:hypothetical protein